jgi:hypothetical protein
MIKEKNGIKSRYLHGNDCASEVMHQLARIITDFGGNIDPTLDSLRQGSFNKQLGLALTDHLVNRLLPQPLVLKIGHDVIVEVKAGGSMRYKRTEPALKYEGFTGLMSYWYEKSNIPNEEASYELFELNVTMSYSEFMRFIHTRSLEMPSICELTYVYRFLPQEIRDKIGNVNITLPPSEEFNIDLVGITKSETGENSYNIRQRVGQKKLPQGTLMLVRKYPLKT